MIEPNIPLFTGDLAAVNDKKLLLMIARLEKAPPDDTRARVVLEAFKKGPTLIGALGLRSNGAAGDEMFANSRD